MDDADVTRERLSRKMANGSMFRSFAQHGAFAVFKQWLEDQINDKRDSWLRAETPEEAELIRIKTSVYKEVLNYIEAQIKAGDSAAKTLEELSVREAEE